MAGPGNAGPPAKGGKEDVEYQLMKATVLDLRRQNMTHAEIAALTGYERSTVTKLLKRIFRELLEEAGAEEVRAMEVERLEKITQRLMPALVPEDPEVLPSLKAIDAFIRVSTLKANYTGAFAPKQLDLTVKQLDDDDSNTKADEAADAVNRYMELADRILQGGVGSGRATTKEDEDGEIIDAEVVEDTDQPADEEWTESEEEVAPPLGEWVNGKFQPNLELLPAPPPDSPER